MTLDDYGIQPACTLQMLLAVKGGMDPAQYVDLTGGDDDDVTQCTSKRSKTKKPYKLTSAPTT